MSLREIILASIFFTTITLLFFYKIFLGLIPLPTDLIVGIYHPWLEYKWGYDTSVPYHNSVLSDAVSVFYPLKSLAADFAKKGELPLWNPYMFGGYPLYASAQLGLLFPTMIFYLLFSQITAWTLQMISQPLIASLFMYLLLRHFSLGKLPSIFGSIAYGFGGFTLVWMEWNTQAATSMFLPILILLEDKYLSTKKFKWGVLLSIFISLQIFAGYLPIILFTFIGMTIWYLFKTNRLSNLKILFFVILGVSLSSIFLLPVGELAQMSQRKVETLGVSGNPFVSLENYINLIAPDFFGNTATRNFWGKGDYLDTTLYTGVTVLIFSLIALKQLFRKTQVKFAFCLFIVTITISVSNPLSSFLYQLGVWGGSSIALNRMNFLINFSLAILGAYGISTIKNNISRFSLKPSIWVLSIVIGATSGLLICRFLLLNNLTTDNANLWLSYLNISFRNLLLPSLIIISVFLLLFLINKLPRFRHIIDPIFILILIFELFRFGLKFNTFSSPDFIYPNTPVSDFLQKHPNDRVIAEKDVFPANMWVPFRISSIAGYDGIYPLNVAQLLATANSGQVDVPPQTRWGLLTNFNSKIIDESNTRFIITVKRDTSGQVSKTGLTDISLKAPKYQEVFNDKGITILENTQVLPRIYLTKTVIKASDKTALKLMIDDTFPIRTTSIADFDLGNDSKENVTGALTYQQVTNSHTQIKTSSNMNSYLVVLDSYYPGWKALIDGKETTIHRTNYNFIGILLPKGVHIVEFIYSPKSLMYGTVISGISLGIIILLLLIPRIKTMLKND